MADSISALLLLHLLQMASILDRIPLHRAAVRCSISALLLLLLRPLIHTCLSLSQLLLLPMDLWLLTCSRASLSLVSIHASAKLPLCSPSPLRSNKLSRIKTSELAWLSRKLR